MITDTQPYPISAGSTIVESTYILMKFSLPYRYIFRRGGIRCNVDVMHRGHGTEAVEGFIRVLDRGGKLCLV
jgi:hypothetical protein